MSPPSRDDAPISYLRVLGPVVTVSALLVGLCVTGFWALSGVRAYVAGESLWSKARATAMAHLWHYTVSRSEDEFQRFEAALAVPAGDRVAREEMDKAYPDHARARSGLIAGGNHPEDVRAMIAIYRCCASAPLIRDAVAAWAEGDRLLDELRSLAQALHDAAAGGGDLPGVLLQRLTTLDAQLRAAERRYSLALGEASRAFSSLLVTTVLLLSCVSVCAVTWAARRHLRRHSLHKQQLARANRRWELATQSNGVGVFEWNVDTEDVDLDARACALLGMPSGPQGRRLAREDIHRMIHPDDLPETRALTERVVAGSSLLLHRYRVLLPGGELRHIEASGLMEQGRRRTMVGVVRDVTGEIERTQNDLERTAAERVDRARIEFLSRLSHELRTPLNAVLGFSQLMQHDTLDPLSTGQRARIDYVIDAGDHLLRLVNDVLDLTRIDAGSMSIELTPTPLAEVLKSALQMVDAERQANDVTIIMPRGDDKLRVMADPHRLTQVLVNLLSNACKYNRRGGSVHLETRIEGQQLFLAVHDEGQGLPPQSQEQLFQPFKRLHVSAKVPGTGLGLVIVRLLMEKMGGAVHVSSTVGEGSSFTLRIAVATGAVATASPSDEVHALH